MGSSTGSKINQLLKRWPNGTVAVSSWLEKQGAYQQLVQKYEATAWLRRVGQGAYAKAGDKIEWTGGQFAPGATPPDDRRSVRSAGATEASDPRWRKNRASNARVCSFFADGKRHNGLAIRASRCETAGVVQAISLGHQGSVHHDESFCR